jgi:hypothetical protein
MRLVRWVAAPLGIVALLTAGDPVRDPAPAAAADEVVLLGDSLAQEASPYLERELGDTPLHEQYWGGTAPCDWLGKDLHARAGSVVVISFTGNALTPCMEDEDGAFLHGTALVDKYWADVGRLVVEIRSTGRCRASPARWSAASSATTSSATTTACTCARARRPTRARSTPRGPTASPRPSPLRSTSADHRWSFGPTAA